MAVAVHCTRPLDPSNSPVPEAGYYRRVPERALADLRLPRSALAVLGQLDAYARDKAECWPSVATLAQVLGLCRRTIQLALNRLKACGYVAERPAVNPTGRVLVLLWKQGGAKPASPGAQPYSQGLPREGRKGVRPNQSQSFEGRKGFGSASFRIPEPEPLPAPRRVERPPTEAEKTQSLRDWIDAIPAGTPLARTLAARLAERLKA